MSDNTSGLSCPTGCWLLAGGVGLVTVILLLVLGGQSLIASLFLGLLVFGLLGLLFVWLFCSGPAQPAGSATTGGTAGQGMATGTATASAAAAAGAAAAQAADTSTATEAPVASATADTTAPVDGTASAVAEASTVDDSAKDDAVAATTAEAAAPAAADDADTRLVRPTARLAGQEDLASRKGSWTYQGDTSAATDAGPVDGAAETADAGDTADTSDADAPTADPGPDYDKDGILEGSEEGTRPEALDGPRDGKADNLKEIKGIGPKLEKLCNSMGFYHFDQIANWTADEIAWVNANLEGFKGRVSRDNWVEQAKILAAGGETEFSKRVEDGDVY